MTGLVALVASCTLRMALGDATFYDVSISTEARGENLPATPGIAGEIEADPRLGLNWMGPGKELGGAYAPRLMWQEHSQGLQVLQRASVNSLWQIDGNWRSQAAVSGSYGEEDLLLALAMGTPTPGASGPLQPIPRVTWLKYASGEASVNATGALTARSRLTMEIGAFVEGGANRFSSQLLPLERGVRLTGELAWTASSFDTLATGLATSVVGLPGIRDETVLATETWRHSLTQEAQVRIGAGPGFIANGEGGHTSWMATAGGELGVHDRWQKVLDGDLSLRVAPMVDRITGAAYSRADAVLALTWQVRAHWSLFASGTAGIITQGIQAGQKIAGGEFRLIWSPTPIWDLSAGTRGLAEPGINEGTVFFALTVRQRDRM
ncbi:MAG TPA: hypothetical protein VMK12_12105 [Anaeromyxobacteraceae bacterium]|nr:hypothetical protein [Anaeromyxobacteraceae bacterium]